MKGRNTAREIFDASIGEYSGEILERIVANVKDNEAEITTDAIHAFESLCDKALSLQETGTLGKILTISFSLLRTSFAQKKGLYLIEAYDDDSLKAECLCEGYWEASFAFDPYFALIAELKKKKIDFGPSVRDVDIEEYTFALSVVPQLRVEAFISGIARILAILPSYTALARKAGCTIMIGEYNSSQKIVYPENDVDKKP
jgi:hypothetical protein